MCFSDFTKFLWKFNENTYDHLQEFLKIYATIKELSENSYNSLDFDRTNPPLKRDDVYELIKHANKDLRNEVNEINKKLEKLLSSQGTQNLKTPILIKPTGIIVSLGDRSIRYLKGLIEDVIINIEGCYFSFDFLILDMMPPENLKESAIILGRAFSAIVSANINCATRIVDMYCGGQHISLNVFKAAKFAKEEGGEEYDVVDSIIEKVCMFDTSFENLSSGLQEIFENPSQKPIKTTFTCPFDTFAFTRMPFGLCNAPATFERCMISLFSDMLDDFLEVFMDDFSIFGSYFDECFGHLKQVLARCVESKLVLS
ncbi:unnamed protein product [Spirodela intermedia]|uniref:Reverse transcriptase domain-containing protein n=1 Tax=Spirodela intermedia TaxID=51605 RepID=A0A7I8JTV7_SPIIN|nr:unnamed protein product [Spirodela intermedia]CAA6673205.1 unnamed protein product [Spirodela intermedia]